MFKTFSAFALVFITSTSIYSQINIYYQSAIGLSGEELKNVLHEIIDDHITYPYTSGNTDVWDILKETDRDQENSENVILLYTGRSVNAAQEYNSGNGWTREHVWAKSHGDFGTSPGAGTDVHHLRPLETNVNSIRNNRALGNCIACQEVVFEGFPTGSYTDTENWIFEPRDEVKGDVARMIFYMALRYEGDNGEPDLELTEEVLTQNSNAPLHGILSNLLEWNLMDSVSSFERNRNDIIYNHYQGNRNPFIDHPELAEHLWGHLLGETWPQTITNITETIAEKIYLYPNPGEGAFTCSAEYSSVNIYDNTGRMLLSFNPDQNINITALPDGIYFARIETKMGFVIRQKLIKI